MNYQFDSEKISLDDLQKRIETTDLVPSRASLLDGLAEKIDNLKHKGMITLAQLRTEWKTPSRLEALAKTTGIDGEYLMLLKREVESYFPKSFDLKEFSRLPKDKITRLEESGIRNTADLFVKAASPEGKASLVKSTGVDAAFLDDLFRLADLTRIQWISPTAARMLVDAGYDTPLKVEKADADVLCETMMTINKGDKYFKGNIGLRDIKRLVHSAKYVSLWYFS
jgi:hypothetical protein